MDRVVNNEIRELINCMHNLYVECRIIKLLKRLILSFNTAKKYSKLIMKCESYNKKLKEGEEARKKNCNKT